MEITKMPEKEGPNKSIVDIMVAGYLARCNYVCSYKCLTEESPYLRSQVQCANGKIMFDDLLHGKRLDEIIIMFNECNGVLVPPAFLDFGTKLRDLVNEYTALTNPDVHYSSVQKSLFGKRVPPRCHSRTILKKSQTKGIDGFSSSQLSAVSEKANDDHVGLGSPSSARRKCTQPISTKNRLVENVMQAAQHAIEGRTVAETTPMADASTISLGEAVIDNLDGSFLSYFPEMVASEFDMLDLGEASTSQSGEIEESHGSQMNLAYIPQHNESKETSAPDQPDFNVSTKFPEVKEEECKKPIDSLKKKKKLDPLSRKKPKALYETTSKVPDNNDVDSASVSSSSGLELSSREVESQKNRRRDLQKLSLEDLFDDGNEAHLRDTHDTLDYKQRAGLEFKEKKVGNIIGNEGHPESHENKEGSDGERRKGGAEAFLSSSNTLDDMAECEAIKIKQKVEEGLRKAEGWVKLTAGKRDNSEGKSDVEEPKRVNADQNSVGVKKFSGDERKGGEMNRKLSEGKRSVSSSQKDLPELKNNVIKKMPLPNESRKEKFLEPACSPSPSVDSGSAANDERTKDVGDIDKLEEQYEAVVKNMNTTESSCGQLEEGELLPSPQKPISKPESSTKDEVKQSEKRDKKSTKSTEEKPLASGELNSKERKKKERELRFRKEREEVEKLRRRQIEDEDRRAAYREQKRKKELEKEATEREEREKRRREKLGKTEDRKKMDRETDKRGQRESSSVVEGASKNKLDFVDVRGGSREKLCRLNIKSDTSLEETLFGVERTGRKQREMKVRESSENRPLSKKSYPPSDKYSTNNATKKEELKLRGERDSKTTKADCFSVTKKIKTDVSTKRQDISIDNLFETMTTPPGCSKKEEATAFEQTKRSCDFLRRVIATVEEKSGGDRTKKEKVVSSGVDKGRPNLLVRGGHSARGLPGSEWFHVGMVLEMATRIRRKLEHEAAAGTTTSSVTNLSGSLESKVSTVIKSATTSSSSISDKELVQRKRVLDMPLPKPFSVDLVGDILKETGYKETQVNRLKRYGIKKLSGERSERSPLISSADSSHASSLASASPHSYSSPDINVPPEESTSFFQPSKKPRLEDNDIDSVLNSIYGDSRDD